MVAASHSVIALDFETKSRADLKKVGTDNYASHLSTDILCCSFILTVDGVESARWLWFAAAGSLPFEVVAALRGADEVQAQNARFDQLIYECIGVEDYEFPPISPDVWTCTMAQARVNALPADLDGMTRAGNAKHKKDHGGKALIRQLSIPDKNTGLFNSDPMLMGKMGRYCADDTAAMVGMSKAMRDLTPVDKRDWHINERINDRGMRVDLELAELAQDYAAVEKKELGIKLAELTGGEITAVTQGKRLVTMLLEEFRDEPEYMACLTRYNKDGTVLRYSGDKTARDALLALPYLDDWTREVIELFAQGSNSSVSKFSAMLQRADPETERVHGAFIYAGAGQTGRYSSKGLQLHNMRRDCWNAAETEFLKSLMRQEMPISRNNLSVMDTLAKMLRPAIIPADGHSFVVGDWSAIEARVLPWLSKSSGGEAVLDVFREGRDIYMETATSMKFKDRQIGKVAVLSLGFGGAVGALQAMCKNYGVSLTDAEAGVIVNRWRNANPWAREFWNALENAAKRAWRKPHKVQYAGRIRYVYIPELLGGTLMCVLPDDSCIQYPYCRMDHGNLTAMKASVKPSADNSEEWPRMQLWGGFLAENVTQATAACLLKEKLRECDLYSYALPVVGHCHDEIILEVANENTEYAAESLQSVMETCPTWAEGLPLQADPAIMTRYGK